MLRLGQGHGHGHTVHRALPRLRCEAERQSQAG